MDPLAPSDAEVLVTLGVDTHADVHVGVALDRLGRRLGSKSVPTTMQPLRRINDKPTNCF